VFGEFSVLTLLDRAPPKRGDNGGSSKRAVGLEKLFLGATGFPAGGFSPILYWGPGGTNFSPGHCISPGRGGTLYNALVLTRGGSPPKYYIVAGGVVKKNLGLYPRFPTWGIIRCFVGRHS